MSDKLTIDSILALKNGVALRYEHNFQNGTTILIDTFNDNLWFGNSSSLALIKQLRNNKTKSIGRIFSDILVEYDENDYDQIVDALNQIINDLLDKKFISIIC